MSLWYSFLQMLSHCFFSSFGASHSFGWRCWLLIEASLRAVAASCSCLDDNFAIVRQIDNNRHWTIISASCLADTTAMPVERSSNCAVPDVGEHDTA
eukprot:scaffold686_cov245-Skeletonema_marinoi.AAC.6